MIFRSFLMISLMALTTQAGQITGQMYEQGSNKSKQLYNYQNTMTDTSAHIEVTDMNGKLAVSEQAELNNGKLVRYEVHQEQLPAKGIIEVKGDRVYFTREMDGKTKTDDEKLPDNLVVSANFSRFVKDHWQDLSQGKEIDIRYGVWDRMETVGFTLKKMGEEQVDGAKLVSVRMKPTSFIIAAIVKPVFLYYSQDGDKLLKLNGRVPPKQKVGDKWKDLDAEVYYQHKT